MNKFKKGDIVRLKEEFTKGAWILEGKIESIRTHDTNLIATKASEDMWIGDPYRELTSELYKQWEIEPTYRATKQFDEELQELLDD